MATGASPLKFEQGDLVWSAPDKVRWLPLCEECGDPVRGEAHRHLRADIEAIIRELRPVMAPSPVLPPTHQREPAAEREYLTMRHLADYSGYSIRWLRDRIRDAVDPLAASGRGGKLTVRRSEYDSWIARHHERERISVSGVVDDVIAQIGRG